MSALRRLRFLPTRRRISPQPFCESRLKSRYEGLPKCHEFIEKNLHNTLYRFSPEDFTHRSAVFNGTHPEDGTPLTVKDGVPDGHPLADLPPAAASGAPSFDMDELREMTARLMKNM